MMTSSNLDIQNGVLKLYVNIQLSGDLDTYLSGDLSESGIYKHSIIKFVTID